MRRTSNSDNAQTDRCRDEARQRNAAGEEHHAEAEQQNADGEKEIVEAGHEAEAFVFRSGLLKPRAMALGNEGAQGVGLRLRHHAGGDRGVDVFAFDAQSFSTVTLRLV